MNQLVVLSQGFPLPAMVEALPESGRLKFLEFFAAQIRNANTRRSYAKAAVEFLRWCELWVRLHEKGGKQVELPCHHTLESYLDDYIEAAGLKETPRAPLFQTFRRGTSELSGNTLTQPDAFALVRRRAVAAGISTAVCNHTFRATGITAYLKNGGTLEKAANIANHSSTRTKQLYDRRDDDVSSARALSAR